MTVKHKLATTIATAAAIAFITAPITSTLASANSSKVPCYGVKSCKSGKHDCKENGMKMLTAKQCKKMHGTTEMPKETTMPKEDAKKAE